MNEGIMDRRKIETAKRAFFREIEKLPHHDITSSEADGLCCLCVVYGDHLHETELPYSAQAIHEFIEEEARRSWRRIGEKYKDRAQNRA